MCSAVVANVFFSRGCFLIHLCRVAVGFCELALSERLPFSEFNLSSDSDKLGHIKFCWLQYL